MVSILPKDSRDRTTNYPTRRWPALLHPSFTFHVQLVRAKTGISLMTFSWRKPKQKPSFPIVWSDENWGSLLPRTGESSRPLTVAVTRQPTFCFHAPLSRSDEIFLACCTQLSLRASLGWNHQYSNIYTNTWADLQHSQWYTNCGSLTDRSDWSYRPSWVKHSFPRADASIP